MKPFNFKNHLRNMVVSFKYPNYRLWFTGQVISLFGTWMQTAALGFFIFEMTKSPAYLGYVAFAAGLPSWLFMLLGGVVADRLPRRKLLLMTQTVLMFLAFLISALTFAKIIAPWQILIIAFVTGTVNAFDAPAWQAFVTELVDRDDLTNAIALNSTMFNLGTALGPTLGGVVYAIFGPAYCFLINAISFLAVLAALFFMKIKSVPRQEHGDSPLKELAAGIRYLLTQRTILIILLLITLMSLFGFSFTTLLPAWAVSILKGNAMTNGVLQSARGFGAMCGALIIASLGHFKWRGKLLSLGMFSFPLFLLCFSFIHFLPFALLFLVLMGGALIFIFNLANSLIQTLVDDHMRGRIMSIYSLNFFGFSSLGGLLVGGLAQGAGAFQALALCSFILLGLFILIWLLFPVIRRLE